MERYKDIFAEGVVTFGDGSAQVNGYDMNGKDAWVMVWNYEDATVRESTVAKEEE